MVMIETIGLTKTFQQRRKPVQAVRGVDLKVFEGEIFGFLGPNGAGKTTTMRIISTLLDPTSGEATVCGYDLRRESRHVRTRIGYVGQKGGAEAMETGRENLTPAGTTLWHESIRCRAARRRACLSARAGLVCRSAGPHVLRWPTPQAGYCYGHDAPAQIAHSR